MGAEPAKRAAALSPTLRAQCLVCYVILGLAPQALFCHLLRRFQAKLLVNLDQDAHSNGRNLMRMSFRSLIILTAAFGRCSKT
jgi:hypothetical protein